VFSYAKPSLHMAHKSSLAMESPMPCALNVSPPTLRSQTSQHDALHCGSLLHMAFLEVSVGGDTRERSGMGVRTFPLGQHLVHDSNMLVEENCSSWGFHWLERNVCSNAYSTHGTQWFGMHRGDTRAEKTAAAFHEACVGGDTKGRCGRLMGCA